MKEESINTFLQGKVFYLIIAILGAISAYVAWLQGTSYPYNDAGICSIPFLQGWQNSFTLAGFNYALILLSSISMIILNKNFSFLGGITMLFSSVFIMLNCAVPDLSATWNSGFVVSLVTLLCTFILFSSYEDPKSTKRIYLLFVILSTFSMAQVSFVYLLPLFMIGTIQVRIFSLRTLLATIFGIITPYWIALGMGLVNPLSLNFPTPVPIYMLDTIPFYFLSAAVVAFIGIVSVAANFFTLMKYRLQLRVYNGFILLMMLFSAILMIFDANNALAYFGVLNIGVSMQLAHVFLSSTFKRRYIFVLFIFVLAIANYILAWQM